MIYYKVLWEVIDGYDNNDEACTKDIESIVAVPDSTSAEEVYSLFDKAHPEAAFIFNPPACLGQELPIDEDNTFIVNGEQWTKITLIFPAEALSVATETQ